VVISLPHIQPYRHTCKLFISVSVIQDSIFTSWGMSSSLHAGILSTSYYPGSFLVILLPSIILQVVGLPLPHLKTCNSLCYKRSSWNYKWDSCYSWFLNVPNSPCVEGLVPSLWGSDRTFKR
jgi:hypothetical protein